MLGRTCDIAVAHRGERSQYEVKGFTVKSERRLLLSVVNDNPGLVVLRADHNPAARDYVG